MKRTSNHSEQGLFREEVLSFTLQFMLWLARVMREKNKQKAKKGNCKDSNNYCTYNSFKIFTGRGFFGICIIHDSISCHWI